MLQNKTLNKVCKGPVAHITQTSSFPKWQKLPGEVSNIIQDNEQHGYDNFLHLLLCIMKRQAHGVEHPEDLGIDLIGIDEEPEDFVASVEMMESIRAFFLESGSYTHEKTNQYIKERCFKTAYRHAHNLKTSPRT